MAANEALDLFIIALSLLGIIVSLLLIATYWQFTHTATKSGIKADE